MLILTCTRIQNIWKDVYEKLAAAEPTDNALFGQINYFMEQQRRSKDIFCFLISKVASYSQQTSYLLYNTQWTPGGNREIWMLNSKKWLQISNN